MIIPKLTVATTILLGVGLSAWAAPADRLTAPITVSGRATDEEGKPVQGATVYLVSTYDETDPPFTATTDRDGRYRFRDVPLPVTPEQENIPSQGQFQVFGTAPGHGFAWHGMRSYQPKPRPAGRNVAGEDYSIFQGEPLVMDLRFPTAAVLGGRIVDEERRPLSGVKVRIIGCDYLDTKGKETHPNYREFWSIARLPAAITTATTDEDGHCRFEGLPKETGFGLLIEHPDYARQTLYAATTDRPATEFGYPHNLMSAKLERPPVRSAIFVVLRAVRRIAVRTVLADTGQPAPRVRVSASRGPGGPSASGTSDADGALSLRLPPGEYNLCADPTAGGADCIRTLSTLTVASGPVEQSLEVCVKPGCVVLLEVVDAATGKGIPGVSFLCQRDEQRRSRSTLQSRTGYIDNPSTNAEGRLRAVVEPGGGIFSLGTVPRSSGYLNDGRGKHVALPARGTVTIQFDLRK